MLSVSQRQAGLVFACGCLAFIICLYPLSATLVDGHFIPADADSFYHARRILDALSHPWHVAQFDARIHAPGGSWSPLPWAYDTLMALIGSVARLLGSTDALSVLVFVAPLCVFLNVFLVYGIGGQLGMSFPARLLAALTFALSPLTQSLHRVGMLDHHFVEQGFVLAILYGFLSWLRAPEEHGRALRLALLLGAAPAFHAGLFILQLPVLACLALLWLQRRPLPLHSAVIFSLALVMATLAFLLPSQPFRAGLFTFTLSSWFHAYIAALTALATLFLAAAPVRAAAIAGGLVAGLLLGLPLLYEMRTALGFLSGTTYGVGAMAEMHSVFAYVREGNSGFLSSNYTWMLWLTPLVLALLSAAALRAREDRLLSALTIFALFGFSLLLLQFRLHYFGSLYLYLPLLLLTDRLARGTPQKKAALAGASLLLAIAYIPALASLRTPPPPGGSPDYALTRPIFAPIHAACRQAPGVLLADNNDGHYLSFHADCPTIASNIILSARDTAQLQLAEHLLRSSVETVRREAPYVRYLYVRRNDNFFDSECGAQCPENRGLRQELLGDELPRIDGLTLLAELRLPIGENRSTVVARFFALSPPGPISSRPPLPE